jgi:hypothetical protein
VASALPVEDESDGVSATGTGSEFIIVRLMELILVEILRSAALRVNQEHTGLLAGLADPIAARTLSAMHRDVTQGWTVDTLQICRFEPVSSLLIRSN